MRHTLRYPVLVCVHRLLVKFPLDSPPPSPPPTPTSSSGEEESPNREPKRSRRSHRSRRRHDRHTPLTPEVSGHAGDHRRGTIGVHHTPMGVSTPPTSDVVVMTVDATVGLPDMAAAHGGNFSTPVRQRSTGQEMNEVLQLLAMVNLEKQQEGNGREDPMLFEATRVVGPRSACNPKHLQFEATATSGETSGPLSNNSDATKPDAMTGPQGMVTPSQSNPRELANNPRATTTPSTMDDDDISLVNAANPAQSFLPHITVPIQETVPALLTTPAPNPRGASQPPHHIFWARRNGCGPCPNGPNADTRDPHARLTSISGGSTCLRAVVRASTLAITNRGARHNLWMVHSGQP